MSQHYLLSKSGRQVLYGYDAPTGGYFYTEFLREDEENQHDTESAGVSKDGLTLTDFLKEIQQFEMPVSKDVLLRDFFSANPPTPLQVQVGKMFGKDILGMLDTVTDDIRKNWYLE